MVKTRKTVFLREVIETDSHGEPCQPVTRVALAAVFKNPLTGRFERDLSPLFEIGAAGTSIDLPLGHKDNPWSFDHFDTMTLCVPDGPAPDEIVMFLAYADRGRPIPRCGKGPVSA